MGISYDSDPRKAMELCVEAARSSGRVLNDPEPRCLLTEFGDNSVNLELRFWINDPSNGVGNARSEVLLSIWDRRGGNIHSFSTERSSYKKRTRGIATKFGQKLSPRISPSFSAVPPSKLANWLPHLFYLTLCHDSFKLRFFFFHSCLGNGTFR